jgi:hypothetical protein
MKPAGASTSRNAGIDAALVALLSTASTAVSLPAGIAAARMIAGVGGRDSLEPT